MSGERDPAPAVTRSIALLSLLEHAHAPLTLTDLAKGLGIAKSSALNLCVALEAGQCIERVPQGYRLGARLARFGAAYASQFNQVREFFGVCEASPVLSSEVVQIVTRDGADAVYLGRHEGRHGRRLGTPIGSRLPLALSATGNALLMELDDAEIREIWGAAPPIALTAKSTVDVDGLLAKIHAARERGYASDPGESFEGVFGVAVPLPGWSPSDPPLAIGAAIPADAASDDHVRTVAEALRQAAAALTNPLAH